jgi:hypothetical protein
MGKPGGSILPCTHAREIVSQVRPTQDLLTGLDTIAPSLLLAHGVQPHDYHNSQVFRTAVESIRGHFAASMAAPRQGYVRDILSLMKAADLIDGFQPAHATERWDYQVTLGTSPQRIATIEVKGGEGNSLNISERWEYTQEFVIWCHLDGAIQNDPSISARAIIGRLVAEILTRKKRIDALIIRDRLCGTHLRQCPKYTDGHGPSDLGPAPDVFLFPQQLPDMVKNQCPPLHTEATCSLPFRVLDAYGVAKRDYERHVWQVEIEVRGEDRDGQPVVMRRLRVTRQGQSVLENVRKLR